MFREYSQDERDYIFATLVYCLPMEQHSPSSGGDIWSNDMIATFHARLLPSIDEHMSDDLRIGLCQSFKGKSHEHKLSVFTKVHLVMVHHGHFNARGTVFLRKLKALLGVSHEHSLAVHGLISKRVCSVTKTLTHARDVMVDEYRYFKVGLIALSAGVALAVTGGLVSNHLDFYYCSH